MRNILGLILCIIASFIAGHFGGYICVIAVTIGQIGIIIGINNPLIHNHD